MDMSARDEWKKLSFLFLPLLRQYILKELCPKFVTNPTILLQSNYSTLCIYSHFLIRIAFSTIYLFRFS